MYDIWNWWKTPNSQNNTLRGYFSLNKKKCKGFKMKGSPVRGMLASEWTTEPRSIKMQCHREGIRSRDMSPPASLICSSALCVCVSGGCPRAPHSSAECMLQACSHTYCRCKHYMWIYQADWILLFYQLKTVLILSCSAKDSNDASILSLRG